MQDTSISRHGGRDDTIEWWVALHSPRQVSHPTSKSPIWRSGSHSYLVPGPLLLQRPPNSVSSKDYSPMIRRRRPYRITILNVRRKSKMVTGWRSKGPKSFYGAIFKYDPFVFQHLKAWSCCRLHTENTSPMGFIHPSAKSLTLVWMCISRGLDSSSVPRVLSVCWWSTVVMRGQKAFWR